MTHEHKVQQFYDSALHCYQMMMGDRWHHEDPDAMAVKLPRLRGQEIMEERIVALTGLTADHRALDFGAGIGGPTLHMAKVSSASFIGVSNNDRLNRIADQKAADAGMSDAVRFQTIEDTGYKHLPFEDGSFDVVTFFESTCHVTDKAALFREFARVLEPGGRVGGADWIQRPFGEHQTEEQIGALMAPVYETTFVPGPSTVESYTQLMEDAGLEVFIARDVFAGILCWGTVTDEQREQWLNYEGPEKELFRAGEEKLVAARLAGVFSVGMWIAGKPG